jgi:Fic family protein
MGLPHILNTITKMVFQNKNKYFHYLCSMTTKNIITSTFEMQLHQYIFKIMLLKWRVKIHVQHEGWE